MATIFSCIFPFCHTRHCHLPLFSNCFSLQCQLQTLLISHIIMIRDSTILDLWSMAQHGKFVSKMVAMTGTQTTDFLIAGQVCYPLHYHGPGLPRQISTYILPISRECALKLFTSMIFRTRTHKHRTEINKHGRFIIGLLHP